MTMMNFKPVLAVTLAALILSGCATRNAKDIPNEFAEHWQQEARDRQGYSPAPTDLQPEPRVLLSQSDAALQGKEKALPGQRITLKLQNAGVDTVLRAMANAAGVSLMMAPGIKETTSINVKNARWSDVFLSILNSNGLDWQWQGNILQVVTLAEKQRLTGMMNLNNQLAEAYQAASHTGPLSVQVVNVRYSDAKSLKESLSKFVTRNKDAVIEIDEHNNALILQGTAIEQKRMLALIDHLDRPRPQVLLKAYIVETTKEKARELGMQWGGKFTNGSHTTWGAGDGTASSGSSGSATASSGVDPSNFRLDYSSLTNAGSAGLIGLTHVGTRNVLEAQLNLMEREGVLNILSSAALRRKLDAVMQENHQHLAQTAIIAVQHIAVLVHAARNLQLFLRAQLSAAAHSVVNNIHHIQRRLFNREICILQTRQVKQVVNQTLQKQALLIHLLMELLHVLLLRHHAVAQGLQTAADNRHRRAQLMRNIGDKLTPQLLQLLAFLIRQLQASCQLVQRACQLTDFVLLADIAARAVIALCQTLSDILHNIERLRKAPAEQHCQQHA